MRVSKKVNMVGAAQEIDKTQSGAGWWRAPGRLSRRGRALSLVWRGGDLAFDSPIEKAARRRLGFSNGLALFLRDQAPM
jgi:hypothetical protein